MCNRLMLKAAERKHKDMEDELIGGSELSLTLSVSERF